MRLSDLIYRAWYYFRLGLRRNSINADGLCSWYYSVLSYQATLASYGYSPFGNYYEFGVGVGSLSSYITALKAFCKATGRDLYRFHIFGFDSFEGLPNKQDPRDDHVDWYRRKFSVGLDEVTGKVAELGIDLTRGTVRLVKGFFEDTLTSALRNDLKKWPPSIVNIDVDYYSSTKAALSWLRPLLQSGAIFYFDDTWSFHGNPHLGELAAINEFNELQEGGLVSFPELGMIGHAYIFWNKSFEFKGRSRRSRTLSRTDNNRLSAVNQ